MGGYCSAKDFLPKWRHYIDIFNKKDVEMLDRLTDELVAVDAVWHIPGMDLAPGAEGQKAFAREVIANNPDFRVTIDDVLLDGDKMIIRLTMLTNNQATGEIESSVYIEIDRIADGKVVESWAAGGPGKW